MRLGDEDEGEISNGAPGPKGDIENFLSGSRNINGNVENLQNRYALFSEYKTSDELLSNDKRGRLIYKESSLEVFMILKTLTPEGFDHATSGTTI